MKKRNILTTTLYIAGKILSNLPVILITLLMVFGVIGLVMVFLLNGADWGIFGALISRDIVDIAYGMLLGIASIVAWIGFSKRKEWARKVLIGICAVYLTVTFLNVIYHYTQGISPVGYLQNSILQIFLGLFSIYVLTYKKIKERLR